MFDYNAAEKVVLELLAKTEQEMGEQKISFMISEVIEQDFGWVFLYEDENKIIVGNAPLIFDKADGVVYLTGKADTLDSYIELYRRGNRTRA